MCSFCAIYAQNTVTDSHNHAQEQRSRSIEWRNSYVTNANPVYSAPKECASPPRIITALRKAALTSNPARHPIWRTADRFHAINHQRLPKERAMNEHRARAVNAICACIADRLNIVTGKVFMTLAQISDSCGLTTYPGGLIIQAGDYPDLTPCTPPESYYRINELIRPIRYVIKEDDSLHFLGEGHFTDVTSKQWYERYDRGPMVVSPLYAGEPARVDGYWTTKGRENVETIFLQGTPAIDIEGNPPGRTEWRLIREIPHDDERDLTLLEQKLNGR